MILSIPLPKHCLAPTLVCSWGTDCGWRLYHSFQNGTGVAQFCCFLCPPLTLNSYWSAYQHIAVSFSYTLTLQCQVTREWRGVKTDMKNCGHRVEDPGKKGGKDGGPVQKGSFLLSLPFIWRIKEFFSSTIDLTHIHIAPSPVNC